MPKLHLRVYKRSGMTSRPWRYLITGNTEGLPYEGSAMSWSVAMRRGMIWLRFYSKAKG